jgi:hypothetical protein
MSGTAIIYWELYGKTLPTAGVLTQEFALGRNKRKVMPDWGYVRFAPYLYKKEERKVIVFKT